MINSRTGQNSKWPSQIWKLYDRGSKDFLFLTIKPIPIHTTRPVIQGCSPHWTQHMSYVCICKYMQNAHNSSRKRFL